MGGGPVLWLEMEEEEEEDDEDEDKDRDWSLGSALRAASPEVGRMEKQVRTLFHHNKWFSRRQLLILRCY